MMLEKDDIVEVCAQITKGYVCGYPSGSEGSAKATGVLLSPIELRAVFPLALMRICVSICMSNYNATLQPDNEYILITGQPGWRMLRKVVHELGGVGECTQRYLARLREFGLYTE